MAETEDGRKWVVVRPYEKRDGTEVRRHARSTPRPPKRSAAARPTARRSSRRSGR